MMATKEFKIKISSPGHARVLRKSFIEMFEKQELCDVTLICQGGAVNCHRLWLAAQSSFLRESFKQINKFNHQPQVQVKGVNSYMFLKAIHFFYYGFIPARLMDDSARSYERIIALGQEFGSPLLEDYGIRRLERYNAKKENPAAEKSPPETSTESPSAVVIE